MQALYPPDGTEGECEAIAAGPSAVGLAGKGGRGRGARRLQEAGRGGGEAHEGLGQVQLSGVPVAPVAVLIALGGIGGGYRELGGDLVQRVLRVGQAELALEQRGLGRVLVRRAEVEPLGGIQQLLRLLDEARQA